MAVPARESTTTCCRASSTPTTTGSASAAASSRAATWSPGRARRTSGAEAARAALADAGVEAGEVDYLVCATMTPDHYFPGSGTLIQEQLGMAPLPALDMRQQCAGFAYGLQVVDALIRSGTARTVLLVGTRRPYLPDAVFRAHLGGPLRRARRDRSSAEEREWNSRFRHLVVLFGDAAGAMVFRAHDGEAGGRGILGDASLRRGGRQGDPLRTGCRLEAAPLRQRRRCRSGARRFR